MSSCRRAPRPLHKERLINRLMRHPHLQVVRKVLDQARGDLRRRPQPVEAPFHLGPQPRHRDQLRGLRARGTPLGLRIGAPCTIRPAKPTRDDLARDRREGARPNRRAIWRQDSFATKPREISLRARRARAASGSEGVCASGRPRPSEAHIVRADRTANGARHRLVPLSLPNPPLNLSALVHREPPPSSSFYSLLTPRNTVRRINQITRVVR